MDWISPLISSYFLKKKRKVTETFSIRESIMSRITSAEELLAEREKELAALNQSVEIMSVNG